MLVDATANIATIVLIWTVFAAGMYLKGQHPRKPGGVSRWLVLKVWYNRKRKKKLDAYCGYHFALIARPGMLAMLDSANCVHCKRDGKPRLTRVR